MSNFNVNKSASDSRIRNLDQIDSILSTFETSVSKTTDDASFAIESSPILNNTLTARFAVPQALPTSVGRVNSTLLTVTKRTSSLYSFSTPKIDSNQLTPVNSSNQHIIKPNENKNNTSVWCEASPIIRSQNTNASFVEPETPYLPNVVSRKENLPELENVNRNLLFEDDENQQQANSNKKQIEMDDEDDEIMAHISEIENRSINNSRSNTKLKEEPSVSIDPQLMVVGFKTARDGVITVKKKTFDTVQSKEAEVSDVVSKENIDPVFKSSAVLNQVNTDARGMMTSGFSTAGGKSILVKKEAYDNAVKRINPDEPISEPVRDKPISTDTRPVIASGFSTAGGRAILVSKENIENAVKKIKEDENGLTSWGSESSLVDTKATITSGFNTAGGKSIAFKKENFEKAVSKVAEEDKKEIKQSIQTTVAPPPRSTTSGHDNSKSFRKPRIVNKSKLEKPNEEPKTINTSVTSLPKENMETVPSNLDPNTFKNVHVFRSSLNETNRLSYLRMSELNVEQVRESSENKVFYRVKPVFELVNCELRYEQAAFNETCGCNRFKSSQMGRLKAMADMIDRLEARKNTTLKPSDRSSPGYLFNLKLNSGAQRVKLTDLNFRITTSSVETPDFYEIKFNVNEYDELVGISRNGFMMTADNGCLVSDEQNRIGFDEIHKCFLDSSGVDAKIADINWFKNHFHFVAWKLYSYDRRFSNCFVQNKALSPLNILNQIKYRYDVEVGNAKRSCLKKIVEKDDTSLNRLLILFVSKIFPATSSQQYIQLSDGWYPIKALCDQHLSLYIRNEKIKVGDKLAIFSSELIGCPKDGCLPLEAPDEMHLRLSVNSTRKAKWFARLGLVRPQRSLIASLKSIQPNSPVGAIHVIVERIYPYLYIETNSDGKVFRNERQEELFVKGQMSKQSSMSPCQNEMSNNMPPKRNVTQILKIRVSDVNLRNSTALLTIWHNPYPIREKLFEGQHIKVLNINATTQKNGYQEPSSLCLSTLRHTSFIYSKKTPNQTSSRIMYEFGQLYENRILCPFNEIDTCGIVLMQSENQYHNLVFLTNLGQSHSVICICFPKKSEFYGFGNLFKSLNVCACLNLRVSTRKEFRVFPSLVACDTSLFTQRLNSCKFLSEQYEQLDQLKQKEASKNRINELIEEIKEQIKLCESGGSSRGNDSSLYNNKSFSNTSLTNFKLNNSYQIEPAYTEAKSEDNKTKRLSDICQVAGMNPIQSKSGAKLPGLMPKNKSSQNLIPTSTSTASRPLKRTSDHSSHLSNRSYICKPVSKENKVNDQDDDDEDDLFLRDQNLDELMSNSTNSSMINNKRFKAD